MSKASNIIDFTANQNELFAILHGADCKPTPRHTAAAPTIPGILSVLDAAGRAVAPGRHAGGQRAAYNAALAAADMLLFRVAQVVVWRAEVSQASLDKLCDAADACELAGDVAVADRQHGLAEKWYDLANRPNADGFRALSCSSQV